MRNNLRINPAVNHQKCCLCNDIIGFSDYEYLKTKPLRYGKGKKSTPTKIIYLHTRCYNKEFNMNLPIFIG